MVFMQMNHSPMVCMKKKKKRGLLQIYRVHSLGCGDPRKVFIPPVHNAALAYCYSTGISWFEEEVGGHTM